jgi:regulatory protein
VPVVTALRATRRGGVALHLDDEYVCVVSESLIARWRLFKGRELSEGDVAEIRAASSGERVRGDAYRLLGHRARSREELRRRLLAKEHDEHAVEDALERLAADGLLDDAAFARSYVADKRQLASWGVERIRRGLRELGVDSMVIDEALGGGSGGGGEEGEELDLALAVLRRRGAPEQPLDAARRRAFQALQRRGFSSSIAYAAVRLWVEGEPPRPN